MNLTYSISYSTKVVTHYKGVVRLGKKNNETYLISSVDNALEVLLALSLKEGLSIRELSKELGISRSTLYRILRTLQHKDFVRQDIDTEKYSLGFKVFELGTSVKEKFDIRNIAYPYLKELRDSTGETVQLAAVDKEEIVILEIIQGIGELRIFSSAGLRFPITYGNFGKVFLAQKPDDKIIKLIEKYPLKKYAVNSIIEREAFLRNLEEVRSLGFSIGIDDPIDCAFCIASPIFDHNQQIIASIGLSGPKTPSNMENLDKIAATIKDVSQKISRELGFVGID